MVSRQVSWGRRRIAVTTFGCDGGKSGIGHYVIRLLREFAALDAGVRFDVFVHPDEQAVFLPDSDSFTPIQVPVVKRPPISNVLWHQWDLPRWCRRNRCDVLFLPAANRRAPVTAPCPTVGTFHDLSSVHVAAKYDPLRLVYIKRVLPALARRLSHVISVSETTKRDLVHFAQVPPCQITVIQHGVDASVLYPRDRNAARHAVGSVYGISGPYVLYVSRIEHPGKNHVRLISAFARAKARGIPHQLVLAGNDWSRAGEVHKAAAASGCSNDIVFGGYVPDQLLPDLYCGADAFIFPSLYEGFGMPLLEAMASGIPVACSNASSMPEVVGDAAVLFEPRDESEIAEAILRILHDEGLRKELVARGLARSRLFTWRKTAEQTLDVLLRAARGGVPGGGGNEQ